MPRTYRMENAALDAAISALVAQAGHCEHAAVFEELVVTALKMLQEGGSRWDARILRATVKEMRWAFKVFAQYRHRPKVTFFGSARIAPGTPRFEQARQLAAELVARGYMIMTGAGPGIMEAGNLGAGAGQSFGLNVELPFEQEANPAIDDDAKLIRFRFFFTRKLFFVKEACAFVMFPGGFGTLDEACTTLTLMQTGRTPIVPIVLVDVPGGGFWQPFLDLCGHLANERLISPADLTFVRPVDQIAAALAEIAGFYRRFHSLRNVSAGVVLRLHTPLPPKALADLSQQFADLLRPGSAGLQAGPALPEEANEPDIAHLPRVLVPFDRRSFARLRQLIDAVNAC